jgi:hypothetical protein
MSRFEVTPASAGPIERVMESEIQSDGRITRPGIHIALTDMHKATGQMKPETTILIVDHVLHRFARQAVFRG